MKQKILGLCFGAVIAAAFLWPWQFSAHPTRDPDRYYHIALSREMVRQHGILREIPQIPDLGWDKYFPDKEFLFHVYTATAYALGKNNGVIAAVAGLSVAILLILFAWSASQLGLALGFVFVMTTVMVSPSFLFRLTLLRPHVLGILLFVLFLISVLKRNLPLTMLFGALYALAYHAVYLPGLVVVCWVFAQVVAGGLQQPWHKTLRFGFYAGLGILIGVMLNPYFPSNIYMGWQHLLIALKADQFKGLGFALELEPYPTTLYLENFLFLLLHPLLALIFLARSRGDLQWLVKPNTLLMITLMAAFWVLAGISPRALEYAVPSTVIGMAMIWAQLPWRPWQKGALFAAIALLQCGPYYKSLVISHSVLPSLANNRIDLLHSLEKIPHASEQTLLEDRSVFHTSWDDSPYIFYYRPDLQFVDLLDPTFFFLHDPRKAKLRDDIAKGKYPDPVSAILHFFHSRYILSEGPELNLQLFRDPRVEVIYRPENGSNVHVFFIKHDGVGNGPWAKSYDVQMAPFAIKDYDQIGLHDFAKTEVNQGVLDGVYLMLQDKTPTRDLKTLYCAHIVPAMAADRQGARYLGVDGTRAIHVWWNGQPFYTSRENKALAQPLEVLVPLPKPWSKTDRVDAVACASGEAEIWGAALSLWKPAELPTVCEHRDDAIWPYVGRSAEVCEIPLAAPNTKPLH